MCGSRAGNCIERPDYDTGGSYPPPLAGEGPGVRDPFVGFDMGHVSGPSAAFLVGQTLMGAVIGGTWTMAAREPCRAVV